MATEVFTGKLHGSYLKSHINGRHGGSNIRYFLRSLSHHQASPHGMPFVTHVRKRQLKRRILLRLKSTALANHSVHI